MCVCECGVILTQRRVREMGANGHSSSSKGMPKSDPSLLPILEPGWIDWENVAKIRYRKAFYGALPDDEPVGNKLLRVLPRTRTTFRTKLSTFS